MCKLKSLVVAQALLTNSSTINSFLSEPKLSKQSVSFSWSKTSSLRLLCHYQHHATTALPPLCYFTNHKNSSHEQQKGNEVSRQKTVASTFGGKIVRRAISKVFPLSKRRWRHRRIVSKLTLTWLECFRSFFISCLFYIEVAWTGHSSTSTEGWGSLDESLNF